MSHCPRNQVFICKGLKVLIYKGLTLSDVEELGRIIISKRNFVSPCREYSVCVLCHLAEKFERWLFVGGEFRKRAICSMRHRSSIESILTFNAINSDGEFTPMRVGIHSWVSLQPGKHGGHAKDARRHSEEGGYKARILKFRLKEGSTSVIEVLVQHAYVHRQLVLEPGFQHGGACNYWIDPKTIMDVIYVMHAEIGEMQRGSQSHRDLLKIGVYFYNALFFPPSGRTQYGRLENLPLPGFEDPEWPLPDMVSSESFRSRFRKDFQSSMKPTVGSRSSHINWFLPIHMMVDFFAVAKMHRTPTLFTFKDLSEETFDSLMDDGWDSKICIGADIIKCIVDKSTVIFRYHIARSTLYAIYQYNRQSLVQGSDWVNLEQREADEMVQITCLVHNREEPLQLQLGSKWTLSSVRQEIIIACGYDLEEEFGMWITENGQIIEKINARKEKKRTIADVLPPKALEVRPQRT